MNKLRLKEWWFAIIMNILCIAFIIYIMITMLCCGPATPVMGRNGLDTIPPIANPQYHSCPYQMEKGDMRLFFSINNVVETFIEDNICCCLYDDPDAFDEAIVIEMSRSTFYVLEDVIVRAGKCVCYSREWCDIAEKPGFVLLYRKWCDAYMLIMEN